MSSDRESQLSQLLDAAIASFDIPDTLYELAVRRYKGVGQWLSTRAEQRGADADVFVQGSFRLGTVTRPIGPRDQYDIDMVDKIGISKHLISQAELKAGVGADLRAYVTNGPEGHPTLREGKRCWTLEYPSDPFHIDVLPAIPDPDGGPDAILLTDKHLRAWQHSDPIGYSEWFRVRMADEFARLREEAARTMEARDVEEVPEWKVKTTLQRTVQALKRHRDIYFESRPGHHPASIIITTLAARSYSAGESLFSVLVNVIKRMPQFVEKRNGEWWVPNPAQPAENFTDRWREHPELAASFFKWISQAQIDFESLPVASGVDSTLGIIAKHFGDDPAKAAGRALGTGMATLSGAGQLGLGSDTGTLSAKPRHPAPRHTFHGGDAAPRLP